MWLYNDDKCYYAEKPIARLVKAKELDGVEKFNIGGVRLTRQSTSRM